MKKYETYIFVFLILICRQTWAESEPFFYQDLNQAVHYKIGFDENCHQVDFDDANWLTINLYTLSEHQHYCIRALVDIT